MVAKRTLSVVDVQHRCFRTLILALALVVLTIPASLVVPTADASARSSAGVPVIVEKWVCPPGTPAGKPFVYYLKVCEPAFSPFQFALTSEAGTESKKTEAGVVAWADVSSGRILIIERPRHGYGDPIIFCEVREAPTAVSPQPMASDDGMVVVDIDPIPDLKYVCYWFNVENQ